MMMSDYRSFDQLRTNELYIVRYKWFNPYFELTDGQFVYGRLSYKNNFKRNGIIETADSIITLKPKGWFKRNLVINEGEDETIGTLIPETWKRDVTLEMDNGFKATYRYKKLFSRSFTLTHELYGDILNLNQMWWSFGKPFTATIEVASKISGMPSIPFLALTGLHLTLLRQQQAAAS
jgi:hypothetical protein